MVETHGRHDPCVGIRAAPIAEAMLALVVMDHALRHRAQNGDVSLPTSTDSRQRRVSHPAPAAPAGSLVPFGVLSLAYYASVGVFNPYTPLWFQSLGFSTLAIGAIASLQAWSRVVAPYAWSWIGDHWAGGTRRVDLLRLAALLALLASLGLLAFTDVAALSIVVLLIFLANGAVLPLSEATLSQRLATTRGFDVGRYGRVRVWGSVGFIVAVTVCGVLLQFTGIAALPGLVVLVYALLMFAAWRLPRQSARLAAAHANAGKGVWQVLRQPVVAWFMAGVFFTVLSHTSLYAFLSLYLDSLGYSNSTIGVLWAVSVAAEIVFFWTQGRWFAIWPATTLLVAAALASALRFGAMATLRRVARCAGAGAKHARADLRCPARVLHQHDRPLLLGPAAWARPGALQHARLRRLGRHRRRGRRRNQPALRFRGAVRGRCAGGAGQCGLLLALSGAGKDGRPGAGQRVGPVHTTHDCAFAAKTAVSKARPQPGLASPARDLQRRARVSVATRTVRVAWGAARRCVLAGGPARLRAAPCSRAPRPVRTAVRSVNRP